MKSLEIISNEITILEAERDFGDITPEGLELLAALNLCYDLLSRTTEAQKLKVPTPPEMIEPGFDDDETPIYGVSSSQLADFAFTVATKTGTVDLRKLLREIISPFKQKHIAASVGIRANTISDYLTGKKSLTTDNYEKVINSTLKK